ncbi:hypothetical protein RND81_11G193700 [Saponaria officinalis]|uniref:Pentatricopeptide repeat-containing protein n=1 Tax=Saponaria officinalis TaxID=3572 RepID=A0AAW1HNY1_SAPOF
MMLLQRPLWFPVTGFQCSNPIAQRSLVYACMSQKSVERVKKSGKREHHMWKSRDSAGSGQKAMNLVRIVSGLPNEKEAVYRALDEWTAWELEFPLIAAAKALKILRERKQWLRVIQVAKWMLSKGQGTTMATYDTVLLAFDEQVFADMEELGVRPDEDTVRRIARAFEKLDQVDKKDLVLEKYGCKWKYIHFKGERVKVRKDAVRD